MTAVTGSVGIFHGRRSKKSKDRPGNQGVLDPSSELIGHPEFHKKNRRSHAG
jgi:hypothetical protein